MRGLIFILVTGLASELFAEIDARSEDYFGVRYREGRGIEVSAETKKILRIETARVIESGDVVLIPAAAVLKTISGSFVYVVNGKRYLRTEIKGAPSNERTFAVSDGLYAGDEVVRHPVRPLWYAELQALRGGKACTDGH